MPKSLRIYVTAANYDQDFHHAFSQTVKAIHEIGQENVTDFIYKAHPGLFALAMVDMFEGVTVPGAIGMAPQHPVSSVVSGYDAEELEIKKEIVAEIVQKHGLLVIDPAMFGEEMADAQSTDYHEDESRNQGQLCWSLQRGVSMDCLQPEDG